MITILGKQVVGDWAKWRVTKNAGVPRRKGNGAFGKAPLVFKVSRYRVTGSLESHDCATRMLPNRQFGTPRLMKVKNCLGKIGARLLELQGANVEWLAKMRGA